MEELMDRYGNGETEFERVMEEEDLYKEIVINSRMGGFDLSEKAEIELKRIKKSDDFDWVAYYLNENISPKLNREDIDLINLIKNWGSTRVSGDRANLKIVKIPKEIDYTIQEYDGHEWIAEKHRTWK